MTLFSTEHQKYRLHQPDLWACSRASTAVIQRFIGQYDTYVRGLMGMRSADMDHSANSQNTVIKSPPNPTGDKLITVSQ